MLKFLFSNVIYRKTGRRFNVWLAAGFTLIELLVVAGIVAVIATVVAITLNPTELLRKSRDGTRLSDLKTLTSALNLYQVESSGSMGNPLTIYVSLPDPAAIPPSRTDCASLNLPSLPMGYTYACTAPSAYRNVNGSGWIPVDFTSLSFHAPLAILPIDPINAVADGFYYTYAGGSWELTAKMESAAYNGNAGQDGGSNALRYEVGTDLALTPDIGDGSSSSTGGNPDPTVASVFPPSGSVAGGTSVSINGTGFAATPGVSFGGASATGIIWISSTTLAAVAPAHGLGAVNVVVTNPDAKFGACAGCFTYTGGASATTTVGNGVNPSNTTLSPGGSATALDAFTFQTSEGIDTVSGVTVTLAPGTTAGIGLVEITSDNGAIVYGFASNPSSSTVSVSLSTAITAATSSAQYKVRMTPRSHAAMPAPPGASYAVTGTVTDWTGSNAKAGTDTSSATVTIDNLSSGNVTAVNGTPGDGQVALGWTNPADSDFSNVVILRATSTISVASQEGSSPLVNDVIDQAVVRYNGIGVSTIDTGLTNGTGYYYKIFSKDTRGNYAVGVATGPYTPIGAQTITEQDYRFYANADSVTPGSALAAENAQAAMTATSSPIRIRMNLAMGSQALTVSSQAFKLQFSTATSTGWADVGASGGAAEWRFYNNPTPGNGVAITSLLLTSSDVTESYEESNPTVPNPSAVPAGQKGEWDFPVDPANALNNTTYYFRAVKGDGTPLDGYINYPAVVVSVVVSAPGRYWVGGTGNWNDTVHWAATSGGAGGAAVPISTDNVYFDANSFTAAAQSVTVNVGASVKDINWTGATNNPTWAGGSALAVYGSLTLVSGMTRTYTGAITFAATTTGNTITLAGKTLGSNITFNGAGGEWILQDAFVTTGIITHSRTTLNANNQNVTAFAFASSNSNTRTIMMGSGTWTITAGSGLVWNLATVTGLTLNPETSNIVINGSTVNPKTFAGGGKTYGGLQFTAGTGILTVSGSNTFSSFAITNTPKSVTFTAGTTQTITGSFTANGAAGSMITLRSTTAAAYTINSAATSLSYVDVQWSTGTGAAAPFACGATCVNSGNNTGWSF